MIKFKSHISILLLLVWLAPIVGKSIHEIEHMHKSCNEDAIHFCNKHHSCEICDFVIANATTLTETNDSLHILLAATLGLFIIYTVNIVRSIKYTFLLRGPPVIHPLADINHG